MADEPIWQPSDITQTNLFQFMQQVAQPDYAALYQWSIAKPAEFWQALWDFCEVKASQNYSEVLIDADKMPGAKWFVGAKLNFAENLLSRRDDKLALVFHGEDGRRVTLTYAELYTQVARAAQALRDSGVTIGDRVAGFLPNMPETIIAMLATTSIGAIWSSCSPDFGSHGILDRFGQIQPKVLFTADGQFYNGKRNDSLEKVKILTAEIASVEKVVVVPYLEEKPDITHLEKSILFNDFLSDQAELTFEQLPFDHPLCILYSSGTTGTPKCIVHSAGGTLIQHLKELVLHTDLKSEDVFFYFTTCGWMMWNWFVSGLAAGATLVLFDGAPTYPKPSRLLDIMDEEKISIFGTSAKFISALEKFHLIPKQSHDLSSLRTVLSTGSPLVPANFDYVYEQIKSDVCLSSISGGTDIISCFALGNPVLPVYRGELQSRGLGLQVEIFDEQGQSVHGQKGELVCTAPFPCMPLCFWNDKNNQKYHEAYFAKYPNIWAHGDYAMLTEHDGLIIYGRSDAVLNPGGVRIGTAEIYRQVEKIDEVLESVVIGQEWQDDERVVLFVKCRDDITLDKALTKKIKTTIRQNTTPRHVPAKILQVTDIPRTISGKIVELAVRNVVHGLPVKNQDALANPEALEQFQDRAELK